MPLDTSQLTHFALFAGLPPVALQYIAEHSNLRRIRSDNSIVHQDDPGETFYVIQHGTVKISTTLPDGGEVFLALLAAGDTFGEMSLIDSSTRSADVNTQEETTVISVSRIAFDHLMDNYPMFARNLMKLLARRLRLANVRIQAHCALDVYGMVARQILEFAELYGEKKEDESVHIPIRLTQGSMAELVGASRERVNHVMVNYRQRGFIAVDTAYHITVLKPKDLQRELEIRSH